MKFSGPVIHGDAYGRTLGYPTANIDPAGYLKQAIVKPYGIYAGRVTITSSGLTYPAAIVISQPAADVKLEAHLLEYSGDLYDEVLDVELIGFVRPYRDYQNETELKTAIAEDVIKVRMMCGISV